MSNSRKKPARTWYGLAAHNARQRALWATGHDVTRWAACGFSWDAVAIAPIRRGLDALQTMEIRPGAAAPVLADHVRDVLYVMVPPGTGSAAADLPGVRALSTGHHVLVPVTPDGSYCAHWLSPPDPNIRPATSAAQLADRLRAADTPAEQATAS